MYSTYSFQIIVCSVFRRLLVWFCGKRNKTWKSCLEALTLSMHLLLNEASALIMCIPGIWNSLIVAVKVKQEHTDTLWFTRVSFYSVVMQTLPILEIILTVAYNKSKSYSIQVGEGESYDVQGYLSKNEEGEVVLVTSFSDQVSKSKIFVQDDEFVHLFTPVWLLVDVWFWCIAPIMKNGSKRQKIGCQSMLNNVGFLHLQHTLGFGAWRVFLIIVSN